MLLISRHTTAVAVVIDTALSYYTTRTVPRVFFYWMSHYGFGRVAAPISQKSEKKSNMIKTLKARAPDIPGPSHTLPDTQDTCQHSTEHPDIDLSSIYLSSPPSPLCAEPSYM